MKVGEKELEQLATIIVEKLREEFANKHLSKNLINTIKIENYGDEIKINIPARTYNMLTYQREGVIIPTGRGSYASKLDEEGSSFTLYSKGTRKGGKRIKPGNHKGYVDKIINQAIREWSGLMGREKVKVEK